LGLVREMAITVRKATMDDAARVADFAVRLSEMHAEWDPKRFTRIPMSEGAVQFYGGRAQADNAAIFVAEDGESVVGFAYIQYEPVLYAELATSVAWLHDIYIEPGERGKGAGEALIQAVKKEARRLGANKILLSVAEKNNLGRQFFERNGFYTTMFEMMLGLDD